MGPHMDTLWGTINVMGTIVFLKGLLEENWAKGRMGVLMDLLGGYRALGAG